MVSLFGSFKQTKAVSGITHTVHTLWSTSWLFVHMSSVPAGRIVWWSSSQQNSMKNELGLGQMKVTERGVCVRVCMALCACYWKWLLPFKQDVWLLSCNLHSSNWLLISLCEYTRTLVTTTGHTASAEEGSGSTSISVHLMFSTLCPFLICSLSFSNLIFRVVLFPSPGSYIPRCTEEGYFKPTQCHGSTGQCWCVDKYGNEIAGSRKQGNPNCGKTTTHTSTCSHIAKQGFWLCCGCLYCLPFV